MIPSLLLGCVAATAPTPTFPAFRDQVPRNVLWVSIDTLRLTRLGRYGDPTPRMPFLEALMRDGVTLDAHVSCSNWTWPSVTCATRGIGPTDLSQIPQSDLTAAPLPDSPSLASVLGENGYRTALITSNSWLSTMVNTDYGYDSSEYPYDTHTNSIFSHAFTRIESAESAGQPWFAHVHVIEPHDPYRALSEYTPDLATLPPIPFDLDDSDAYQVIGAEWINLDSETQANILAHLSMRYEGELAWLDAQLASAFTELDDRGWLEDTLVVFWSDHGEQLEEHGSLTHGWGLFREENAALALFWSKNIVPGRWSGLTVHGDLAPTVLTLLGVEVPAEMTGAPLGTAPADRPVVLLSAGRGGAQSAVIQDGWKLIYRWGGGAKELYDLTSDPLELSSVYDPADPRVIAMWETLQPTVETADAILAEYVANDMGP